MHYLKHLLKRFPLAGTILIIALCLGVLAAAREFLPATGSFAPTLVRLGLAASLLGLLARLGWLTDAGIKGMPWHPRWWLATLPMLLIVSLNILGADWAAVQFTPTATLRWVGFAASVGLFEELLLRGLCFCLLYRAWQHHENALLRAAIGQAVIFGLLHLMNLSRNPLLDTLAQTVYATLLGIGFAGLVAYSRSIWPAVLVHAAIDLAGSVTDLIPGAVEEPGTLSGYIVTCVIITLLSTLPGLWLLRKARQGAKDQASPNSTLRK